MPYITAADREWVSHYEPVNPGQLTYALTRLVVEYADKCGPRFQTFAEILGALEATKLEMYRRVVAPYENKKLAENGDCYAPLVTY